MNNVYAESSAGAQRAGPKDIFLHLLSIIALYFSAGSFVALIFQYINVLLPDPVASGYPHDYYSLLSAYSSIRWSLAGLIVVFPVYIWSVWFLNQIYKTSPEKLEIKTRKWLLYFTLFAAAVIVIGDLVTLIYNFLQGELTLRFLLKILTVFMVAGIVFGYYFSELKRTAYNIRLLAYGVIALVAIAIISGFFIVGSPKEERLRRFDMTRVENLQFIQNEIVNFWQRKNGALPKNFDELKDDIRGISIPRDPENGSDYVYEITGAESFKFCASFNRPSLEREYSKTAMRPMPAYDYYAPYGVSGNNWKHPAGQHCFDRKIDKDLYKPEKPR